VERSLEHLTHLSDRTLLAVHDGEVRESDRDARIFWTEACLRTGERALEQLRAASHSPSSWLFDVAGSFPSPDPRIGRRRTYGIPSRSARLALQRGSPPGLTQQHDLERR
jgi:hypothetical protein